MVSHFRKFVVALVLLAGVAGTRSPAEARPVHHHGYRAAYGNPYYYGYAYGPFLYFNTPQTGWGWSNGGSSNMSFSYGFSGFPGGQSDYSFAIPDGYSAD